MNVDEAADDTIALPRSQPVDRQDIRRSSDGCYDLLQRRLVERRGREGGPVPALRRDLDDELRWLNFEMDQPTIACAEIRFIAHGANDDLTMDRKKAGT